MHKLPTLNSRLPAHRSHVLARTLGFTLIEFVVVIILLGVLAAVGLPRFHDSVDASERARLEGFAGAMESAVGMAKAQWVAQGKPNAVVLMDGTVINVDPATGYPVDDRDQTNDTAANMGLGECQRLFSALLRTGETATRSNNANVLRRNDFYVRRVNGAGGSADTCVYYAISEALIAARPNNASIDPRYPALVYTPADGRVTIANAP